MIKFKFKPKKSVQHYLTKSSTILKKKIKLLPISKSVNNVYNIFFFLLNFFFFLFSISLSLKIKRNNLFSQNETPYIKMLNNFKQSYAKSFKRDIGIFIIFSKYFFFFIINKNLDTLNAFLENVLSSVSRKVQFTVFKIILCATTYLKNFYLKNGFLKGILFSLKGKLSWKALSRKKKTVYSGGKTGLYNLKLKAAYTNKNVRTVTGSIGFKFLLFH